MTVDYDYVPTKLLYQDEDTIPFNFPCSCTFYTFDIEQPALSNGVTIVSSYYLN